MRYIGNKESILEEIEKLLIDKKLTNKRYTMLDAFCGTGTVSMYLNKYYKMIINDNMYSAYVYSLGRLNKNNCLFTVLGFNPIIFLNSNKTTCEGFFTRNYAPKLSGRTYFNDFNAGRIDYFRKQIEEWKIDNRITNDEYLFLLACLLESVSKVANIAGVYGAYLKTWDPRAKKEINFIEPEEYNTYLNKSDTTGYNKNINDIIDNIECDILYLDPPYTKNKYPIQYHILETLALNDNPSIKGITGARDIKNISTLWSKHNNVEIELNKLICETKAKYIIMSYSNDGLMSKEFIINIFKRYGKVETLDVREIEYKKYRNSKTESDKKHYEYLFYIEKKDKKQIFYTCPLNYMGGKTLMLNNILPYISPANCFIDLFGGGFNVGINVDANTIIYNDYNYVVKNLIELFKYEETNTLLNFIEKTIKKFSLEKNEKEKYGFYREKYNKEFKNSKDNYKYLYVLILFGFQQQLRFNSKYEFNNTVGESSYNDSIKEKIVSFSYRLKKVNCNFICDDFENIENKIVKNSTVYIDPPYLITLGSYNDGKRGFNGWMENDEIRLLHFIDRLTNKGCKVILSNVIEHKNKLNSILLDWVNEKKYKCIKYISRGRKEVLIINEQAII